MFYFKYLTMHKVQMHAGAIGKLLDGLCVCMGDDYIYSKTSKREHSAILLPYIKRESVFILSIFEWLLKTGFTVIHEVVDYRPVETHKPETNLHIYFQKAQSFVWSYVFEK